MLSSTWMRCTRGEGLHVERRRHQCAVDARVDEEAVDETERTGATQTGQHLRFAGCGGDHPQGEVEIAGPRAAVENEAAAVDRPGRELQSFLGGGVETGEHIRLAAIGGDAPEPAGGEVRLAEHDLAIGDPGEPLHAAGTDLGQRIERGAINPDLAKRAIQGAERNPASVGRELRRRGTLGAGQGPGVELVEIPDVESPVARTGRTSREDCLPAIGRDGDIRGDTGYRKCNPVAG